MGHLAFQGFGKDGTQDLFFQTFLHDKWHLWDIRSSDGFVYFGYSFA